MRGGGGRDELPGGEAPDTLIDGDRDGAAGDGGPDPDVLDGGADGDTVSYAERTTRVVVNLADRKPDGEAGEGDVISAVEWVIGGRGDDRLTGDGNWNDLDGGGGRNELRGGGGEDRFVRARGPITCGSGTYDSVYGSSWRDFPQPDCESIQPDEDVVGALAPYPGWRRGQPVFAVSCIYDPEGNVVPCSVSLRIRDTSSGHRLLARGALRSGNWRDHRLTARLTPHGRLVASRRHGVRAVVRLDESGRTALRWTIRLRVPHR